MIRRLGAIAAAALIIGAPAALAQDEQVCSSTGAAATDESYTTFAAQAFLNSEWGQPDETIATVTPGDHERIITEGEDPTLYPGAFVKTSSGRMLHVTTFGDVQGGGLIPYHRVGVVRSADVQGILALTACGEVYFHTWTQPSFLSQFTWPEPG
ncbi:hypothetical protein [Gymnodinialimonas hymeniacidonis]|uniref:hypothetical protein n=1 Tax=Gymnodinialimonas hymeniacidonis TaxID=3126508 RepID=UPI0034C61EEB